MTEGISRRGFVATTGVGAIAMTAAGCTSKNGEETARATPLGNATGSSQDKMGGLDLSRLSHGDLPVPYKPKDSTVTADQIFKPLYDVLVFIKFGPEMNVLSKVCFFEKKGNDFAAMKSRVKDTIIRLRKDIDDTPPDAKVRDFSNFIFKGASNVVIYVDHRYLSYPSENVPVFFTETLLEQDKETKKPLPANKNKSFYDAAVFSNAIDVGGGDMRDVVYLRNYFHELAPGDAEKEHGHKPIDPKGPGQKYAMNIILLAEQPMTPMLLPMILDPDTGNNGSTGAP